MGKLIDSDVLMTWFNGNYDDEDVSVAYVLGIINEQPEAVVRCKDCRHNNNCDIQYHAQAGDMFFCGASERRPDE